MHPITKTLIKQSKEVNDIELLYLKRYRTHLIFSVVMKGINNELERLRP